MPQQKREGDRLTFCMTEEEYRVTRSEDGGLCVACGAEAFGVEPDACNYPCGECNENQVYGVEELLLMGRVEIVEKTEEASA